MKKSHLLTLLVPVMVLLGAVTATAQTPDELPPALETICDMESGAGYGLCNAYCEAMDCELANDDDPFTEPSASPNACTKVRNKFIQHSGKDLPCEMSCPCYDRESLPFFFDMVNGDLEIDFCSTSTPPTEGITVGDGGGGLHSARIEDGIGTCRYSGTILPITIEQAEYCAQLLEDAATDQGVPCD